MAEHAQVIASYGQRNLHLLRALSALAWGRHQPPGLVVNLEAVVGGETVEFNLVGRPAVGFEDKPVLVSLGSKYLLTSSPDEIDSAFSRELGVSSTKSSLAGSVLPALSTE